MISKHLFVLPACLFVVMIGFGITLPLLPIAQTKFFVFAFVALLAFRMAFITPNLAALISKRGRTNKRERR